MIYIPSTMLEVDRVYLIVGKSGAMFWWLIRMDLDFSSIYMTQKEARILEKTVYSRKPLRSFLFERKVGIF